MRSSLTLIRLRRHRALAAVALSALALTACSDGGGAQDTGQSTPGADSPEQQADVAGFPDGFERLDGDVVAVSTLEGSGGLQGWQQVAPSTQQVSIPSTADGAQQQALWVPPAGGAPQPLIVALHSWSTRNDVFANSPFGQFAEREGWAMIAPDFRGVYERPEATGSELAVQDVLDSVDWAVERGADPERVYVVGFSGGGMMSLLMAGRHPDRFAGAVSWVPIYELEDWYAYNAAGDADNQARYAQQIAASCGGEPTSGQPQQECAERSPAAWLDAARDAGLPVLIGHGLSDTTVPPDHGVRAFDQLADEADRLGDEVRVAAEQGELPGEVPGEPAQSYFTDEDPDVLLSRSSGSATLVLFDGGHDMVFHPGLAFMVAQERS